MSTDSWQSEAVTNRVAQYGIAIGTEKTKPDISGLTLGESILTAGWASGWTQIGVYFTDDDIDIQPVSPDETEINPPTAPGVIALIRDKVGVRRVVFNSYEVGSKVMQYATNVDEVNASTGVGEDDTGYWIEGTDFTRCSVALEIKGVGIMWFPSCEIKVNPMKTNVKNPANQEVYIDVFCVTQGSKDITYAFLEYQPA